MECIKMFADDTKLYYARSNVIFRKFHHCSASIKVNLIKTYCAPYCSQLWVYRRVLGYVKSDSASNMFVNNQVENFDAHNRHLIYSLRPRILNCENSIVVCLNDCFYIRGRYTWTSWQKSLYTVWNDHDYVFFLPPSRFHMLCQLHSWWLIAHWLYNCAKYTVSITEMCTYSTV